MLYMFRALLPVSILPAIPAPKKLISCAWVADPDVLKLIRSCKSFVLVFLYNGWVKWIAV